MQICNANGICNAGLHQCKFALQSLQCKICNAKLAIADSDRFCITDSDRFCITALYLQISFVLQICITDLHYRFALQNLAIFCTTDLHYKFVLIADLYYTFVLQICITNSVRYLNHRFALQICITDLQCITTCGNKKSGSSQNL